MVQTLHILRKDIRRFRYELCVVGALTGAFAWADAAADMPGQPQFGRATMLAFFTGFFLVCAWWFLVLQSIHEESLAGDRQFWVTRPYSWRQLLAAKLLFVIVFVNVPLLAAQVAILGVTSYPALAGIPRLLCMQCGAAAVFLVPAIALGTVTRNLAQFVLAILCEFLAWYIALAAVLPAFDIRAWPDHAAALCVTCAGAALVIGWQFSRRSTNASICAGLCTLLLCGVLYYGLPARVRNAMRQSVFQEPGPGAVSVSIPPQAAFGWGRDPSEDRVDLVLPITISGVPGREAVLPEMLNITMEASSGLRWSSGWEPYKGMFPQFPATPEMRYPHDLFVPRGFYRGIQGAAVTIHGTVFLSLRQLTVVPLPPGQTTRIPGGGFCEVSPGENQWEIFCSSPFRSPYDALSGGGGDIDHGRAGIEKRRWTQLLSVWESPFPDLALSPVFTGRTSSSIGAEITLVREYPRAWMRRDFAGVVRVIGRR